jgi:arabinoxylan arabinofuranohydrolase
MKNFILSLRMHRQSVFFQSFLFLVCFFMMLFSTVCFADNPLVSQVYTADPSGYIVNGRMYVIVTHDQDTQSDYSQLWDYYVFSSSDLINWQDHGIVFDVRTDSPWANLAYAPSVIYRNGTYFLFYPDGASAIGVATSSSPAGPFSDALGKALITKSMPNCNVEWLFDPCIFVDDDGQAYCYFGGGGPGNARVIRVNSDMKSVSGDAITIDAPNFFEASFMHKRNGTYYFSYSTTSDTGLKIDYMTSSSPTSGFQHRGTILNNPWSNMNNNNHHSILEYNGQWYIFYHNRAVATERGASSYQRSICLDRLYYNSDGTIQTVNAGSSGVPKLGDVDAFAKNEAETMDKESGIETEKCSEGTMNLTSLQNGDWIKVANVDFGSGANGIEARVACSGSGGDVQVILDNVNNSPAGSVSVGNTRGNQNWQTVSASINTVTGLHDLFIKFTGSFNVNWYTFTSGGTTTPVPASNQGDVNGDNDVNIVDALLTAQYYVGLNPSGFNSGRADVNCSGSIDIVDALLIAQYYVGLITSFPC